MATNQSDGSDSERMAIVDEVMSGDRPDPGKPPAEEEVTPEEAGPDPNFESPVSAEPQSVPVADESPAKMPTLFEEESIISSDNQYELNENVARDLVKYIRSNTIRNEEQFLLLAFSYASGLSDNPHDFISTVTIGTSSGGKTHVKKKGDKICNNLDVMDASTGTDKVLIYDDDWDDADIISMGELQQPSSEMLEFMKRAHGGDEEVVIRTTRGNPSQGFEGKKIVKDAKSYHFTYAQMDADFEFWNRLLKIPVHESESKNKAVGRMAFGHEDINLGDDVEYGYSFDDGLERLQAHMLDVKRHAPSEVIIPTGKPSFDWDAWEIVEPIFKHGRSESNRIYQMVRNLVKASARINYQSRETMEYVDRVEAESGMQEKEVEAIVADPQDVANVMRCLETLRATTHEIGPRKRAVVEAIKTKGGEDDTVEGLEPIVEFLEESDASNVKQNELEVILEDLEDNHLISVDGDEYTARNWDALGEPRIEQHSELFEGCIDPISGDPFLEAWREYRQEASTMVSDLLEDNEITSTGGEPRELTEEEQDVIDDIVGTATGSSDVADMPVWKLEILGRLKEALDGERVENMSELPVEAFLGLTSHEEPDISSVETKGTILDPDHGLWDVDDKPSEWVSSETKARQKIQQVIGEFSQEGIIAFSDVHEMCNGVPVDATVTVEV